MTGYITVVLCVSLVTRDVEPLFMYLLAIVYLLLWSVL